MAILDESVLRPPFVLAEPGDEEFMFFDSLDDIRSDRFDILWGDKFEGWDSAGHFFAVERRRLPRRWWEKVFRVDTSRLEIAEIRQSTELDEVQRRIRSFLDAMPATDRQRARLTAAATFGELIRLGLRIQDSWNN